MKNAENRMLGLVPCKVNQPNVRNPNQIWFDLPNRTFCFSDVHCIRFSDTFCLGLEIKCLKTVFPVFGFWTLTVQWCIKILVSAVTVSVLKTWFVWISDTLKLNCHLSEIWTNLTITRDYYCKCQKSGFQTVQIFTFLFSYKMVQARECKLSKNGFF